MNAVTPSPQSGRPTDAIAVIGMAGRFAGCDDVDDLWKGLLAGRDLLTRGPVPSGAAAGTIAAWGTMPDRLSFDADALGLTAHGEVAPQHGLLFEALRGAIEDAGVRTDVIAPSTALYASYARVREVPRGDFRAVYGTDPTFSAPLFSYLNDLRGETVMVDSTCASSMMTVRLAVQALRTRECDHALAGAVAVSEPHDGTYVPDGPGVYSRSGVVRPFDRRADGVVPGDGVAALLLKRLDDALADGDPVHAVLRSCVVNNDGRRKAGFVTPSVDGKAEVIRQGLARAGVAPTEIGMYEAHGVGIPVNDQIEATAVREAFGDRGPAVAVGSVKASIGHTDACAGLAALIKACRAVSEAILPATPNTADPIDVLAGTRFSLVPETRPWPADVPRRAGVMSAGIGGSNAFAVIEALDA
jgi:acyl transferase domain-containing protein